MNATLVPIRRKSIKMIIIKQQRILASERQRKRRRLVSDDETSFPAVVSNMTETDIFTALINDELVTSSVSLHRRGI